VTSSVDYSRLRASAKTQRSGTIALILLCAFLALAMLTGGGSRPDLPSHLILRPASVLFGAGACLLLSRDDLERIRVPLALIVALAAIMLVQLIPLPPAIWTHLPGRSLYAEGAAVLGFEQPWRPITLSPARTWNSLVSLLPPLAGLLLLAATPIAARPRILIALIILIGASAILGLAQRAGPPGGALYLYAITNETSAVGFFANRNHQALMLACLFPLLGAFAALPGREGVREPVRFWIALAGAVVLIPLVLATGSRAGLVLSLAGLLFAALLFRGTGHAGRVRPLLIWTLVGAVVAGMIALTLAFAQAESIYRLMGDDIDTDLRIQLLRPMADLITQTFPVGIGFGAFEPVFRVVEPAEMLQRAYVNNAHNDLLQLVVEGGVPAVLVLLAFLFWLARRTWQVWAVKPPLQPADTLARLGTLLAALILAASVVDYPLRTPFVMIVAAISTVWIGSGRRRVPDAASDSTAGPETPAPERPLRTLA
jgi:O-antigen ligase